MFEGFGSDELRLLLFKDGSFKKIVFAYMTDYYEQIKSASNYVVHPEEILAELFRISLTSKKETDLTKSYSNALITGLFKS